MDIEELYTVPSHEEGAEVRLKNPVTGKDTDCYIRVMGVDSKSFRSSRIKLRRELAASIREGKEIEADEYDILIECTLGWRGLEHKGKELEFSKEKVRELYESSPSIAEQVDAFMVDRRNFTKG